MAEVVNFASLQKSHETLLQKQQKVSETDQQSFIQEVKEFIEKAKAGGSNISSTRERDQLRANLRYWANYIYSIDKTFPDTELAPSAVENKPSFAVPLLSIIVVALILIAAGYFLFGRLNNATATEPAPATEFPATTEATEGPVATEAPVETEVVTSPEETSTPESAGYNVTLSSPANGDSITPKIEFRGTFDNLKPGWAIHVLFIKGDKFFPIKEYYLIPDQTKSADWTIPTQLTESAEELSKAQSYSVVLAVSLDETSRTLLSSSTDTGIDINSLPSTVLTFQGTSTVLYRKGYIAIQEPRVVYAFYKADDGSLDLYTSKTDGTDIRRIRNTPVISEMHPDISPDGTKIVYVKSVKESDNFFYSIAIMDSNGENDHEITERTKNVLEHPNWSPDSAYIAYTVGEPRGSSNTSYWNIHVYEISTRIDKALFEEAERFGHRYHAWLPESHNIIFDARSQASGTAGIEIVDVDTLGSPAPFFDTDQDDIEPSIESFGDGYLLTYTVVSPKKDHDIFAVLDPDRDLTITGTSVMLTDRRAAELIDGLRVGNADYPIYDPVSNLIYFTRHANIYQLKFSVAKSKIVLSTGSKADGEKYGDLIIETGLKDDILGFDVGFMEAYFPIE